MSALQEWLRHHNRKMTQDAIDEALMAYITHVEKQRDELLAALEDLYVEFERTREWGCLPMAMVKARAAIANAKGGAA